RVWRAATGEPLRTISAHADTSLGVSLGDPVTSLALSPDGKRVASGSWDKTVKLWDVSSGKLIRTFKGAPQQVESVAFSPDGVRLVAASRWMGSSVGLHVWDAASGRLIQTLKDDGARWVVFSPDGRMFATAGGAAVKLWDAATGRVLRTLRTEWADAVAFSP